MERRQYIYRALPLFILLSCGQLLIAWLGGLGALIVASIAIIITWGVVWMRLYAMQGLFRPEFAVLSILPHSIYFVERYVGSRIFEESPAWQNLYALTWLGFVSVGIASMRRGACDAPAPGGASKDPVFLLMIPLILLYAITTFIPYYTALASL